jgi:transcriptional regulator with XRE-family HTH domain
MQKTIGEKLTEARAVAEVSQMALAEKSGVGLRTIQQIEKGQTSPKMDTIEALAKAMGATLDLQFKGVKKVKGGRIRKASK